MTLRTIQLSQDFPDSFYTSRGIFVKQAIDSISDANVEVEMVSPRAFVLPFKWFPNYGFSKVPEIEKEEKGRYTIYHPRYLYPVPKRFLYRFAGPSYGFFVGRYIFKNLERPDLLHSHFAYPDGYGMLKIVEKWNLPFVVHLRGAFRVATGEATFKTIEKKLLKVLERADLIFSVSHSVKKEYIEMGVPEEKMVVMPNGVNHSLFVPMVEEEAREKLKNYLKQKGIELNLGENIILFVGYLRKRKGVDYLVEAMPEVVKKHKDTTLFLVGEGILEKDLKRRAVELGIRKNLVFISNVPHTQMPLFINASNLIVLPTLAEGRPNIVLEAMLCGKAVVATNVSGIPELITDGKEGILVEPRKKEQLSDAISLVLEDLELRKKLGKNARSRILSLGLDWKTYGKKVRKEYESLLSRKEKKGTISAYS